MLATRTQMSRARCQKLREVETSQIENDRPVSHAATSNHRPRFPLVRDYLVHDEDRRRPSEVYSAKFAFSPAADTQKSLAGE
jgi:hypothetical protein